MVRRFYNSVRAYLGGLALGLGCLAFLASIFLWPVAFFSIDFWTGFTPDGTGMPPAQREAAISKRKHTVVLYQFVPMFVGSLALIGYGFSEAFKERERKP